MGLGKETMIKKIVFFLVLTSFTYAVAQDWQEETTWSILYDSLRKRSYFTTQGNPALFGPLAQTYFGQNDGTGTTPTDDMPYFKYNNLGSPSPVTSISNAIYRFVTGYGSSLVEQPNSDVFPLQHVPVPWLVSEAQLITRFIRGETSAGEVSSTAGSTGAFWIYTNDFIATTNFVNITNEYAFRSFPNYPYVIGTNRPGQHGDVVAYTNLLDIRDALEELYVAGYGDPDVATNDPDIFKDFNSPAFYNWNQGLYSSLIDYEFPIGTWITVQGYLVDSGLSIDGFYGTENFGYFEYSLGAKQRGTGDGLIIAYEHSETIGPSDFPSGGYVSTRLIIRDSNTLWDVDVPYFYTATDMSYSSINAGDYSFIELNGDVVIAFFTNDTCGLLDTVTTNRVIHVTRADTGESVLGASTWWQWYYGTSIFSAEDLTTFSYLNGTNIAIFHDGTADYWVKGTGKIDGIYTPEIVPDFYTNTYTFDISVKTIDHVNTTGTQAAWDGAANNYEYAYVPSENISDTSNVLIVLYGGRFNKQELPSSADVEHDLYNSDGTITYKEDYDGEWLPGFSAPIFDNIQPFITNTFIHELSLTSSKGERLTTRAHISPTWAVNDVVIDSYGGSEFTNSYYYSLQFTELVEVPTTLSVIGPSNENDRVLSSGTPYYRYFSLTNGVGIADGSGSDLDDEMKEQIRIKENIYGIGYTNDVFSVHFNEFNRTNMFFELVDIWTPTGDGIPTVTPKIPAEYEPEGIKSDSFIMNPIYHFDY